MPEISAAQLTAHLAEYTTLVASYDRYAASAYAVPPVLFTAILGLVALNPRAQPLLGPAGLLALLLVLIWLGLLHSMVNHIGLRLVALERLLNALLSPPGPATTLPFRHFTGHVAEGTSAIAGFATYYGLLCTLAIGLLIALLASLSSLLAAAQWPSWARYTTLTATALILLAPFAAGFSVERRTRAAKRELLGH
ncbi:MAG: hypothetical protein L6R30_15995 [Thermoanaerobaculia bacterium]|nr:hypothetical protein [Thermoanaerobaculia bacterium]